MNSAARRLLSNLLLAAVSLVVSFLVLYHAALWGLDWLDRRRARAFQRQLEESARYRRPPDRTDFSLKGLVMPSSGRGRIYRLKPNVEGYYAHAHVRINCQGFRGPDWTTPKRPGAFRIALVGDSFAFGQSIDDEAQTLAGALEYLLNCAAADPRYEVLNFGVPGAEMPDVAAIARQDVKRRDVDAIVYLFNLSDLGMATELGETGEVAPVSPRIVRWLHRLFPALFSVRYKVLPGKVCYIRSWPEGERGRQVREWLAEIVRAARGKPVLIITDYLELLAPRRAYEAHDALARLARSLGIVVVDPYPYYKRFEQVYGAAFNPALQISPTDQHPNERRSGLMAIAALEALVNEKIVPDWRRLSRLVPFEVLRGDVAGSESRGNRPRSR